MHGPYFFFLHALWNIVENWVFCILWRSPPPWVCSNPVQHTQLRFFSVLCKMKRNVLRKHVDTNLNVCILYKPVLACSQYSAKPLLSVNSGTPLLSLKKVLKLPPPAPSCRTSHSAPFPHPRTGRASWSCAVSSRPLAGKSHVLGTSLCSPASAAREAAAARGEPWSACCLVHTRSLRAMASPPGLWALPSQQALFSNYCLVTLSQTLSQLFPSLLPSILVFIRGGVGAWALAFGLINHRQNSQEGSGGNKTAPATRTTSSWESDPRRPGLSQRRVKPVSMGK